MENKSLEQLFRDIITDYSQSIIQSVFISSRKLKYDLPHQREYIWPEVKATNFIETILWHGEMPPVVLYKQKDGLLGIIDGKQRCKAINEFLNDGFSLQAHGLDKLWYLSGRTFSELDTTLQNRLLQAKLRYITVEPRNENGLTAGEEEHIKREIFKRYNMGISALKKEEVYMAQYLHDAITVNLKQEFERDNQLLHQLKEVFSNKSRNTETLIQHIRHLLVLSDIPVNRYAYERDDIINKYYDYYAYHLVKEGEGKIEEFLEGFKKKLNFLMEIKQLVGSGNPWITKSLTAYECIYWVMCICEKENVNPDELNNKTFKTRLANHICGNVEGYSNSRSNYPQYINHRYELMAKFFSTQLPLSFSSYLKADRVFSANFHNRINQYMDERFGEQVKREHFTQTTPTDFTINDILYEIKRKQFCIRPSYQRQEKMTITKASALIESILLNLKLFPIYIFVRADGVREVIDGQQRLLAIIGFLGESYTDEQGKHVQKHKFTLNLEKPVLQDICGKKYKQLTEAQKNRIQDFKLNIIEIKEIDNPGFKPEELYKRLNHKPFPIKEHTFEYWNAYIDNDLTEAIKDISNRYKWLYIRKEDKRMLNLQMITNLCYINLLLGSSPLNLKRVKEVLHFYDSNGIIVIRIKHKANVTSILESPEEKGIFLLSLNHFENDFIEKVILLTVNPKGKTTSESFRNIQLDTILQTAGTRMSMRFIILWLILKEIPYDQIKASPIAMRNKISKIFSILKVTDALERFEQALTETWEH